MGKVIICKGALSEKPLCIEGSGRKLYSLEELCYYVATNIYGIDLGFFNEALLNFVEKDLLLRSLASELRELLQKGNGLKDLVTVLLCASDLYDRDEILGILHTLNRISDMDHWEKRAHLGYQHLKEGNYLLSLYYLRGILKEERISEKDYGLVLMAMGLCFLHTSSYKSASDCFYKAYMHSRMKESLLYTFLALKLGGLEEEFQQKAETLAEKDSVILQVNRIWKEANEKVEDGEAYKEVILAIRQAKETENMDKMDRKLQDFKKEYREGTKHGLI